VTNANARQGMTGLESASVGTGLHGVDGVGARAGHGAGVGRKLMTAVRGVAAPNGKNASMAAAAAGPHAFVGGDDAAAATWSTAPAPLSNKHKSIDARSAPTQR
jgi:hypothetical protein